MSAAERAANVVSTGMSPRFSGRLSRRLLGWFLLFSLIPLFVSNSIGYFKARQIIERLVDRYLAAVAQVESEHVAERLERQAAALDVVTAGNEFLVAGVLRLQGRPSTNDMDAAADAGAVQQYLESKLRELDGLEGLYLQGVDGQVLLTVGGIAGGLQPVGGEATASFAALPDAADGSARFRLAVPIWGERGPVGLLCGVVGLGSMRSFLRIPPHLTEAVFERFEHIWRGQWSNIGAFFEGVADFQRRHSCHEALLEFMGNALVHDKTFRRNAGLPVINGARLHRSFHGRFQIRAGHYEERITASKFEHDFFESFARFSRDFPAGLDTYAKALTIREELAADDLRGKEVTA